MILFPNCKINIGLNIVRKRPDGYHDIETVMVPAGWCDVLEIVPAATGESRLFTSGRPVNCPPGKNLVMKALRALAAEVHVEPVDIYLHKVIPDGAGLGGGSADAAFTLIGVNRLQGLGLSDERLASIAANVGADCPFFIYNRPMLATGKGTDFTSVDIDLEGMRMVIMKPSGSVPTAEAYSRVEPREPERDLSQDVTLPAREWSGIVKNDFEPSVMSRLPEVGMIKQGLLDAGAVYAAMSGSGSAVFGLFEGDIMADEVRRIFPDCDIFIGE